MLSACCSSTSLPPFLPISLNSLDREGVRLLSPRDSQILPKPACRCRGYRADDATKLKEELDEDLVLSVVPFQLINSGSQLRSIRGPCRIWGCSLFWFRSRTLIVFGCCNALFMYLCEVAIVSQLCISFPYVLYGLCEDYLTCDIAFNAVMPLSRASTRGRYSRIEGVTSW